MRLVELDAAGSDVPDAAATLDGRLYVPAKFCAIRVDPHAHALRVFGQAHIESDLRAVCRRLSPANVLIEARHEQVGRARLEHLRKEPLQREPVKMARRRKGQAAL
eukprot:681794-Prymnesium_polylepis.2